MAFTFKIWLKSMRNKELRPIEAVCKAGLAL